MNIYTNKLWIDDVRRVLETIPWINQLSGKSIMITGVSGLVCSAIADVLIHYNETNNGNITIIAAGRSIDKIKERFGEYANRPYFRITEFDATSTNISIPVKADYIIHGASNSSPDKIMLYPVETMLSNIWGLYGLLNLAKRQKTSRLLFISSSEIYGKLNFDMPLFENNYGVIDVLNTRSSYSEGKRAGETLAYSYSEEYGVDTVIVRPGHIYGPNSSVEDKHISSMWIYNAARGEDIVIKSDGNQIRSYCYCLDAATAILTVLLRGESKHAYNISNSKSVISIKKMAELLAKIGNVIIKQEMPLIIDEKRNNPMKNSSLDSKELVKLGWRPCFSAQEGFEHSVSIIKKALGSEKHGDAFIDR